MPEDNTQDIDNNVPPVASEETQTTAPEDNPKDLRFKLKEANSKARELEAQLLAIKQAEIDKNKSLEEKVLEVKKQVEEKERLLKQTTLEKTLLVSGADQDFLTLLAKDGTEIDDDVENIVEALKAKYPKAFQAEKPKSDAVNGKVGATPTKQSEVDTTKMSIAEYIQYINSK